MKKLKGFTVTELMIVVAVIAFLAMVAFWAVRTQVFKGYDARRKADINRIKIAVEEYEKDHDCYPLPSLMVCTPGTGLRPYLQKIPCDPRTGASYIYDHQDSVCPNWYRIFATLENLEDPDYMGQFTNGNYYSGSPNSPYPTGGSPSGFYGCQSGVCVSVNWDPARPGPDCDPNYASPTCYGQCTDAGGAPVNDCQPWQ
jgi:prepilin-type N-terminal cleavage/methylation domain-containing protein